jgi:hypothetical protein
MFPQPVIFSARRFFSSAPRSHRYWSTNAAI